MLALITRNFTRTYTVRQVYEELCRLHIDMNPDEMQAMRTTGNAMIRLAKRHRIRIVRRGKGRQPTIYQGIAPMGMTSVLEAGVVTQ
jgi:2-C-methyl-D-erythritol 4-phosphate cytidylyltransferase